MIPDYIYKKKYLSNKTWVLPRRGRMGKTFPVIILDWLVMVIGT